MRTSQYAVVDGVEYRAIFRSDIDFILVTVDPGLTAPSGSDQRQREDGTVVARLPRARATRLLEVETWALLHGRFPVQVDRLDPDGRAAVALPVDRTTPVGKPVRERNAKVLPPGFAGHGADSWFFGGAQLEELSEVHQTVHEVEV
ncbi:hypothetical protein AA0Y32_03630 [Georgenia phoenicis]|uniref:hypothetical protein n=1 Tax=unclassified Georgenia TaxID=2626815 RepID=UPI0039AF8AC5